MLNIPSEITQQLQTLLNEDWNWTPPVQVSSPGLTMLANALLLILT